MKNCLFMLPWLLLCSKFVVCYQDIMLVFSIAILYMFWQIKHNGRVYVCVFVQKQ